ncbi:MAG: nuclease-related domain-containing protein, partial [Neobacillus sp.]
MAFKSRTEPPNLKRLIFLNKRMVLPEKEKQYYSNLKKGFEGEVMFDLLTEKLHSEIFILNDLLLETNHSEFQIDSTIISQTPVFLFEVKNYEGEHYYK